MWHGRVEITSGDIVDNLTAGDCIGEWAVLGDPNYSSPYGEPVKMAPTSCVRLAKLMMQQCDWETQTPPDSDSGGSWHADSDKPDLDGYSYDRDEANAYHRYLYFDPQAVHSRGVRPTQGSTGRT